MRSLLFAALLATGPVCAGTINADTIGCPEHAAVGTLVDIRRQSGGALAQRYANQQGCMLITAGKQADYQDWRGKLVLVRPRGSLSTYWVMGDYYTP